ncbi:MAG: hypothetical protein FJ363_11820 [Gemmatimonadetes bacterium]|nr:hypothetical protein [Gemmatimonadota bacterium]
MLPSRQAHFEPSEAPRLHTLPSGRCFLGVSARATPDEAVWLLRGFAQLLPRHDGVLVLLEADVEADQLSPAVALAGLSNLQAATDPSRTTAHILNRWQEIDSVRRRLERVEQSRVQIAAWPHFADAVFATLRDKLVTAFTNNMGFRGDVLRQWINGQRSVEPHTLTSPEVRAACLRQIDALAMRLRVAELSGHHAEYGRDAETLVASRMYSGSYAEEGLTVEALVSQPAQRVYRRLA